MIQIAYEGFSDIERAVFQRNGFVVRRNFFSEKFCNDMLKVANEHLEQRLAPYEYEVDVQYPGAPTSHAAEGGNTVRRLLNAYTRDGVFRHYATCDEVGACVRSLFGHAAIQLSQNHHNCIMTKQPGFSSATLWHQDSRYWAFDEENLISSWLALADENPRNGCLRVIPGTHARQFEPGRFDAALFLRPDLPENKQLIAGSVTVELNQGDLLFFHSRLFHAAGRNRSNETKFSVVFTYHESANNPIKETRSAKFPGIDL